MRAVRLHQDGLRLEEIDEPRLRDGEALVGVHAAAITRDELDWPTDRLPAIPSYELSGVVTDVAPGADVAVGDEVYALTPFDRDGAAAESVAVPAGVLARKPGSLDHVHSAALPMPGLTAWQGLFGHGGLEAGQTVLVLGATGGVGHVAVQLARHRGAEAIGVSRADAGRIAEIGHVDLVFDTTGGELLRRAQGIGDRLVSVAEEPERGRYFVVEPNREQLNELARLADAGVLAPEIDSVYPLEQAPAAFERLGAAGKRGKVVLQVS
jgi:NADPH:quinone reductase-like Zn-dependent oxidoreductase